MQYPKRLFSTAALTVTLSTVLVACGSSSSTPDGVVNDPDTETPFTPVEPDTTPPSGNPSGTPTLQPQQPGVEQPVMEEPVMDEPSIFQRFTNDQLWRDNISSTVNTIDFESEITTGQKAIQGNEFNGAPGNPIFRISNGRGTTMLVGDPTNGQQLVPGTSGINTFFTDCEGDCNGEVVEVSFAQPVNAFGAFFIDVEGGFASTGFTLSEIAANPDIAFTRRQGDGTQRFLGFTSEVSFTRVYIHFSTGGIRDGVLMDDVMYALD